jgi:hypothetical protein
MPVRLGLDQPAPTREVSVSTFAQVRAFMGLAAEDSNLTRSDAFFAGLSLEVIE